VVTEVVDRLVEVDLVVAWKEVEGDVLGASAVSVFVVELGLSVDETSSEPRSSAISSPCELDVVLSWEDVVDRLVVTCDVVDSSSSPKASVELVSVVTPAVVLVSASVVDSVVVVRPFDVVPSSSNSSSVVVVESGDVVLELDSRLDVDSSVTDVVSSSS